MPNYWDGLVYLHLAQTPGRTLKDCSAQEIEGLTYQCELLLARKLRMAALEAQGYGLDALSLDMPPSRAHSAAVQSDVKQTEGGGADGGSRGGGVMIDDSDSDSDDLDIPEMGGDNE